MDKKSERMIDLHLKLISGKVLNKHTEAIRHNVSEKSIQRDIDDLRDYFYKQNDMEEVTLEYDKGINGYRLQYPGEEGIDEKTVFLICQQLIHSRILDKRTLQYFLEKLITELRMHSSFSPVVFRRMIDNDMKDYPEYLTMDTQRRMIWELAQAIEQQQRVDLKMNDGGKKRLLPLKIQIRDNQFFLLSKEVEVGDFEAVIPLTQIQELLVEVKR